MPPDISRVPGPNPDAADGQLALAALRRAMFERDEPVRLDRYRLLHKIGQGAQGTVFEAEDVELGRRLAVKVLAARTEPDAPDQTRLLAEARAMASVSHPHVVQVYAAGSSGGQVWIAMELVRGTTLQQWLAGQRMDDPAARAEARRILRCAGEGLAAAHALGFVHRDFKPANVLLGDDGAVKLTDFGLARSFDWLSAANLGRGDDVSGHTDPGQRLDARSSNPKPETAWAGTPRYMSPEQLRGQAAGTASDQFNFAVTVWESLFGVHPFEHESVPSLEQAIAAEALSRPAAGRASRPLIRALLTALRPRADDRHASLHPLLEALEPSRRNRIWIATSVGGAALAATAALWPAAAKPGSRCSLSDASARFDAAAGGPNAGLADAIVRTAIPDAARVATRVERALGEYATRWAEQQHAVCEAGWGAAGVDQRRFDARTACLQQALATAEALTAQLAQADPVLASQAVTAVRGLPDPQRCLADGAAWESPTPSSRALRARVAVAAADLLSGRYRQATVSAEAIGVEATRDSLPAVKVAALEIAGKSYGELSDPRRFRAFTDAYYAAVEVGDLGSMARVGGELARQHAYADHFDEARTWLRHGQAGLRSDTELEVRLVFDHVEGLITTREGEPERGETLLLGVLDALGPQRVHRSETGWLVSLGLASRYSWRGRPEDGDAMAEELREAMTRELGSAHPRLSRVAMIQAAAAASRGNGSAALGYGYEALDLAERIYGPINERTASAHGWLAAGLHAQERFGEAEARFRAAERAAGDAPSKVKARLLYRWAMMRTEQGQPGEAHALLRRAEKVAEAVFNPDSGELKRLRQLLADARVALAEDG